MRFPGLIRAAVLLGAVIAIAALMLPLTPAYDLDVFLHAGGAVLHGSDIYPRVGSAAVYSGSAFVYPAVTAVPFVPLALLPEQLATLLFFSLSACAVLAVTTRVSRDDRWIALLVLCTAFTVTGLQLGSISPLLFVGCALLWKLRDRPVLFALVAAPVVVSKLFLAPLLVWPLLARRYRAFGLASLLAVALLAAGFLAGPLGLAQYARLLTALGSHEARAGFGLISVLRNVGLSAPVAELLAVGSAAFIFVGAYLRFRATGDERTLFCAGIIAALLSTPVLWGHYLVLLPAALLALEAPRRWFAVLALVSWVIAPPHGLHWTLPVPEELRSTGPWFAIGVSLVVFAYASRRASPRLQSRAAPRR